MTEVPRTKMSVRLLLVALLGGGIGWLVVLGFSNREDVSVSLIEPTPASNGVVEWSAKTAFVARWSVTNNTRHSIRNAVIGADCRCHIVTELPKDLLPGESAEVALKILPPPAGMATRSVAIRTSDQSQPIALLTLKINVPIEVPQLLSNPGPLSIKLVAGESHAREMVVDSVEYAGSALRLRSVASSDADVFSVKLVTEELPWGEESRYVVRKYRIQVTPTAVKTLTHQADLTLNWRDDAPLKSVPISIEVLPAVLVSPVLLSLSPTQTRRLTIVPRVPGVGRVTVSFDAHVIAIDGFNPNGGVQTIEVKQLVRLDVSSETELTVRSEHLGDVRVRVLLSAIEKPSTLSP